MRLDLTSLSRRATGCRHATVLPPRPSQALSNQSARRFPPPMPPVPPRRPPPGADPFVPSTSTHARLQGLFIKRHQCPSAADIRADRTGCIGRCSLSYLVRYDPFSGASSYVDSTWYKWPRALSAIGRAPTFTSGCRRCATSAPSSRSASLHARGSAWSRHTAARACSTFSPRSKGMWGMRPSTRRTRLCRPRRLPGLRARRRFRSSSRSPSCSEPFAPAAALPG